MKIEMTEQAARERANAWLIERGPWSDHTETLTQLLLTIDREAREPFAAYADKAGKPLKLMNEDEPACTYAEMHGLLHDAYGRIIEIQEQFAAANLVDPATGGPRRDLFENQSYEKIVAAASFIFDECRSNNEDGDPIGDARVRRIYDGLIDAASALAARRGCPKCGAGLCECRTGATP